MRSWLRFVTVLATALTLSVSSGVPGAAGNPWHLGIYDPGYHNVVNAIYFEFCGHKYQYCGYGSQAYNVSRCETGGTFSLWAQNGQYLGLFQMGDYARSRYGHSWNPWGQARAAYHYFWDSGRDWSPWECKP